MDNTLKFLEGSITLKFKKSKILTPLEERILTLYDNVPLNKYSFDDLRFMILQEFGLSYLIPMGLNVLKENPLIESAYYEGDLLSAVIKVDKTYWLENKEEYNKLREILRTNIILINSRLDMKCKTDRELLSNIDSFNQIINESNYKYFEK